MQLYKKCRDLRGHGQKQAWDILTPSPDSFSVHMDTKDSSQAAADSHMTDK